MNAIVETEHLLCEKEGILQNGLTYLFFNQEQLLSPLGIKSNFLYPKHNSSRNTVIFYPPDSESYKFFF